MKQVLQKIKSKTFNLLILLTLIFSFQSLQAELIDSFVAKKIIELTNDIQNDYPSHEYYIIGLGKNSSILISNFEAYKSNNASYIPLESVHHLAKNQTGSFLSSVEEENLFKNLDVLFPKAETLKGKKILLLDYTTDGQNMVLAENYLTKFMKSRQYPATMIENLAITKKENTIDENSSSVIRKFELNTKYQELITKFDQNYFEFWSRYQGPTKDGEIDLKVHRPNEIKFNPHYSNISSFFKEFQTFYRSNNLSNGQLVPIKDFTQQLMHHYFQMKRMKPSNTTSRENYAKYVYKKLLLTTAILNYEGPEFIQLIDHTLNNFKDLAIDEIIFKIKNYQGSDAEKVFHYLLNHRDPELSQLALPFLKKQKLTLNLETIKMIKDDSPHLIPRLVEYIIVNYQDPLRTDVVHYLWQDDLHYKKLILKTFSKIKSPAETLKWMVGFLEKMTAPESKSLTTELVEENLIQELEKFNKGEVPTPCKI